MKHLGTLLTFCSICFATFGQAPELINYQAVARDNAGNELTNQNIGLQMSVLSGSTSGTVEYSETHTVTTNDFGLFTIHIGDGSIVSGSFADVDWGGNVHYLKVEMDATGGTAYTEIGTSQLVSAPYALYAKESGSSIPGPQGQVGPAGSPGTCESIRTGDGRIVLYNSNGAEGFGHSSTGGSNWYYTSISGTPLGAMASDTNIVIYTTTGLYGFGPSSTGGSNWYFQSVSGTIIDAVNSSGKIVIYTNSGGYGFGKSSTGGSNWYYTSFSGATGHMVGGNRIVIFNGSGAEGFGDSSTGGSNWYYTSISSGSPAPVGTR